VLLLFLLSVAPTVTILLVDKVGNAVYCEILGWKSPLCNDVCHCCVVGR